MNIRYPIYEGVYRILTKGQRTVSFVSFFKFICKVTHFSYTFALW